MTEDQILTAMAALDHYRYWAHTAIMRARAKNDRERLTYWEARIRHIEHAYEALKNMGGML